MTKNCPHCDTEFTPDKYQSSKVYCSTRCSRMHGKVPKKPKKTFKPKSNVIPSIMEFAARMERQHYMCGLREINQLIDVFFMLSDGQDPYSLDTPKDSLTKMWKDVYQFYKDNKKGAY